MQLATTKTIVTLTMHYYTTLPAPITTVMLITALRYRKTTSLYYKASIDSNSLIVRKTSAEITSRINKLQTTFLAIQATRLR
jgi:hypothetical protein